MFRYWKFLYFSSVLIACYAQSFITSLPRIVIPQFESALNAMIELSQVETIEDIDIHSIPYGKEILCTTCQLVFDFLILSHNFYVPDQAIKYSLVILCSLLQTKAVCEGIIDLNMPIFIEIIKRKPDLTAEHVCGTVFEELCATKPIVEWSIDVPSEKELSYKEIRKTISKSEKGKEELEVAHVTDTHVDNKYSAGSVAKGCREPLCCRSYQEQSQSPRDSAGTWGDYHSCDIPWATAQNLLETLAARHKSIKYVYMTGDLIAHNIWETSREANIRQIQDQADSFYKVLGKDVKIFPVLGNHEPHPANVLAPAGVEGYSGEWLYEAFYDAWCKDFPAAAKATFMKGGYYSVTPTPGFRIIGLNSLFGYVYNWWMIMDPKDPGGQLEWLKDTLLQAEARQEKVHILMHGPATETDTLQVWNREYNKLILRFRGTVAGQFVGHTHRDQFYLHHEPHTGEPVAVAWNGGSVTPFTSVNPNYRIYHVNSHTMEVEDFDTYIYNLTEANQAPGNPPNWYKLYSFKQAYNVPSLKPSDINLLVKTMANDDRLFSKYFMYYMKNSDIAFEKGCNSSCKEKQLCKILTVKNNSTHCKYLLQPGGNNES